MRENIALLGIPIDDMNIDTALDRIDEFIEDGRATGRTHQIATVNVDFIANAMGDPLLRDILLKADMATADGMPIVWGSRMLGGSIQSRLAGADLVPAIAQRAAQKGYSIYLLGAAPEVVAKAADILQERHPDLIIAGFKSPPFTPITEMDPAIAEEIKTLQPDILMVAFGNPKQEKWIEMYGQQIGVSVMIGIGGSLDFLTGNTSRAPLWMQRIGLEWFYRLLQDPRRLWRRYVIDVFIFVTRFLRQWWALRSSHSDVISPAEIDIAMVKNAAVANLVGRFTVDNRWKLAEMGRDALQQVPNLILDCGKVTFVDSSTIGTLIDLVNEAKRQGGELILINVPTDIQQIFSMLKLERFFTTYQDMDDAVQALGYKFTPKTRLILMSESV